MNLKKLGALLIAMLVWAFVASAEEDSLRFLPQGASVISEASLENGLRAVTAQLDDEIMVLTLDTAGNPLSLKTQTFAAGEGIPSREEAEKIVLEQFPGAIVLSISESALNARTDSVMEDGMCGTAPAPDGQAVSLLSESLCGTVQVQGSKIVSRSLAFGAYLSDGTLTIEGARAALLLLRPEATIAEIELDEDDGMLLYEGEARIDGVEYEFELNARTGKLLEWDRD